MAFTAASRRKGTSTKHANIAGMGDTFVQLVRAGELAFQAGKPKSENPYDPECEDHDSWNFGWEGMADD